MSYTWSLAPTNRATCKGACKAKIEKGAVRLGTSSGGEGTDVGYSIVSYRCLACVTAKQVENIKKSLGSLESVPGFDDLDENDQEAIREKESEADGGAAAPKGKAKAKAKAAAAKAKAAAGKAKAKAKAATPARPKADHSKIPMALQHSLCDKAKQHNWEFCKKTILDYTKTYPDLVNVSPVGRWTVLHQFAAAGNKDAVAQLLRFGARSDIVAGDGNNAKDVAHAKVAHLIADEAEEDNEEDDAEDEEDAMEEDGEAEEAPAPKAKAKAAAGTKRKAPEAAAAAAPPPAKKANTGRPVDAAVPGRDGYTVVDDWSVMLNQTNVVANNNKYYKIQVLTNGSKFFLWTHWGRVGAAGQHKLDGPYSNFVHAEAEFKSKFKSKSGVPYENLATHDWTPKVGKYTYVETDEQEGDGADSAPLGKLTVAQIEKGQGVLQKLSAALKKGQSTADLSSQFYTLIPHDFGFKLPPAITTKDMLETEEELLKFYLRMGFEEVDKADDGLTPVDGIMDLALPKTLSAACAKLCSASEIKNSDDKGKQHAEKQSGSPAKKMEASLYSAIMLYTSNAIYRQLNSALRSEDRKAIQKYFAYLRMLLEALGRMPKKNKKLWRGVSVDLYDQYAKGSTITWWGVSSCTADIKVAKNFMNGCGGSCTLLTIDTKTATDISEITFFGNEKENLLAPGTQLKVISSKREGKVTEIHMQEVGRVLA